jgi:hypothetical protein
MNHYVSSDFPNRLCGGNPDMRTGSGGARLPSDANIGDAVLKKIVGTSLDKQMIRSA